MMRRIILSIICILLFSSCVSTSVVMKEMYTEYYTIAEEYYNNKNYVKALEYYDKASAHSELTNNCTYKMARIYAQTGDYSSSSRLFTSLLELDPDNSTLMGSLAYVLAKQALYSDAIGLYERIIKKYPYDITSQKNLIMIYNAMGNKDKAQQAALEYVEKFPHDTQVFSLITEEKDQEEDEKLEIIDVEELETAENP